MPSCNISIAWEAHPRDGAYSLRLPMVHSAEYIFKMVLVLSTSSIVFEKESPSHGSLAASSRAFSLRMSVEQSSKLRLWCWRCRDDIGWVVEALWSCFVCNLERRSCSFKILLKDIFSLLGIWVFLLNIIVVVKFFYHSQHPPLSFIEAFGIALADLLEEREAGLCMRRNIGV